jgi:hypothetical protein
LSETARFRRRGTLIGAEGEVSLAKLAASLARRYSTLYIGESAHIMTTYYTGQFETKLQDIASQFLKYKSRLPDGTVRGHTLVWRENWTMHEQVLTNNEYTPDAPSEVTQRVEQSKVRSRLTEPLAMYHRSLVLKELNYATQGAIAIAPSFWASKAWNKSILRKDLGCVFPEFGCTTVREELEYNYDMRHMQKEVVLATILGMLKLWAGDSSID